MTKEIFGNYGAKIKDVFMKCYIKNKLVEAKVIENLEFQGGRYAKVVKYNGEEFVVVKEGQNWKQHVASLQFGAGYRGQTL